MASPVAPHSPDASFFGHPRGLSTLFFTELWERFSYYGMRAILILFMTAPAAAGGLGFDTAKAGVIYGTYTALVYMLALPGGWLADRFLGQRRATLFGGIVIMCGHVCLAVPSLDVVLPRPRARRRRHGAPEAEHQRDGRAALRARRHAARRGLLASTTWASTSARSSRPSRAGGSAQSPRLPRASLRAAGHRARARRGTSASRWPPSACSSAWCSTSQAARHLGRRGLLPPSGRPTRGAPRGSCAARRARRASLAAFAGLVGLAATGAVSADRRGVARRVRLAAARDGRRALRLALPLGELDAGRAPAARGDPGAVRRRRGLLVGVRAGGLDPQPLRRAQHGQHALRHELPDELVPVAELALHHRARARLRLALGAARKRATPRARRSSRSGCSSRASASPC